MKMSLQQTRERVINRIMKGDAFLLPSDEYCQKRKRLFEQLSNMNLEEIRSLWPHHVWGIK